MIVQLVSEKSEVHVGIESNEECWFSASGGYTDTGLSMTRFSLVLPIAVAEKLAWGIMRKLLEVKEEQMVEVDPITYTRKQKPVDDGHNRVHVRS